MDGDFKNKINEVGSGIDNKVEEAAVKYNVSKWVVWIGGAIGISIIIKILL